ncbi:MAG: hypothetical protein MR006_02870 [Arcanobacterium sp.]|nr:hypothetical protein [Arcanobacterium sp.]
MAETAAESEWQETAPWNPAAFGAVHSYASIDAFIAAPHVANGVHRIAIPESPAVDIFTRSVGGAYGIAARAQAAMRRRMGSRPTFLPCFFTGATPDRSGRIGPYFSGRRIQINPLAPVVAVADPILAADPNLAIGWYTGLPHTGTQSIIARALAHIAAVAGRPLLMIGGSGGGFAAIVYAALLNSQRFTGSRIAADSAAFVWNPQVSITSYPFSQDYSTAMFPDHQQPRGQVAAQLLDAAGVIHDLRTITVPKRLLYIQNKSDEYHLNHHAMPYAQAHGFSEQAPGVWALSPEQQIVVADYANGHAPLPRVVMRRLLRVLKRGGKTPSDLVRQLEEAGAHQREA